MEGLKLMMMKRGSSVIVGGKEKWKRMSNKKLAELSGRNVQTITNWVRGHTMPKRRDIDMLCAILECTPRELLFPDTETPPTE